MTGTDFTSKDFRTWAGTVLAATLLGAEEPSSSAAAGKRTIARAIDEVARRLGNTRAVCRKCYVHPAVIEAYLDGTIARAMRGAIAPEPAVLRLLRRHGRRASRLKGAA
jgi:DNA topoisomerase-1